MNYRELLVKYIQHIIDCEGTSYAEEHKFHSPGHTAKFNKEEMSELQNLSRIARMLADGEAILIEPDISDVTESYSIEDLENAFNAAKCGVKKLKADKTGFMANEIKVFLNFEEYHRYLKAKKKY